MSGIGDIHVCLDSGLPTPFVIYSVRFDPARGVRRLGTMLFHASSFSVSSSFFAIDSRCTLSDGKHNNNYYIMRV